MPPLTTDEFKLKATILPSKLITYLHRKETPFGLRADFLLNQVTITNAVRSFGKLWQMTRIASPEKHKTNQIYPEQHRTDMHWIKPIKLPFYW